MNRNSGKEYTSRSNKVTDAKIFPSGYDCKCPRKCPENFPSEDTLKSFFNSFWKLADYSKQNCFLRGLVNALTVSRRRTRDGSGEAKSKVYQYVIPDEHNNQLRVCKTYFLAMLQISWGRLYRCLNKTEVAAVIDARGKASSRKIDDSDVVEHIKSFPCYQSYYTRKDNDNKRYSSPDLNIKKMYDLYKQKCESENKNPVKEKYYYQVFSQKFNLHFKPPSKDSCSNCDKLFQKISAETDERKTADLKAERELHLRRAEQARAELKKDAAEASQDKYVCTFDLQKALPFPKLTTSIAYYKRNLYVYNFGIHCFNNNTAYMHVWDETNGGRGSEDLVSCLRKHLYEHARTFKHIVLFSDSCTGQNRNIKTSLTLLKLVQDPLLDVDTIDLKFMIPGHSFLPNDTEFGIIERASKKHGTINVPDDWYNIIKTAKKKKPQFEVVQLQREEFLSTKPLEDSITNRKKDTEGRKINWLKIRWLRFKKGAPFQIKINESFSEILGFRTLDISKKTSKGRPGRPVEVQTLLTVQQGQLYPTRRQMTFKKKEDMLSLLPYIPPIHHGYFRNLPGNQTTRQTQDDEATEGNDTDDEFFYVN